MFLEHNLGGLDDHGYRIPYFQSHLLRASSRNHAFDLTRADLNDDVRHHAAELYFDDFAWQLISGGKKRIIATTKKAYQKSGGRSLGRRAAKNGAWQGDSTSRA